MAHVLPVRARVRLGFWRVRLGRLECHLSDQVFVCNGCGRDVFEWLHSWPQPVWDDGVEYMEITILWP